MTYETFGQWLKQRRKALDLTQAELASRAGYAVVTLRKLEADQIRPSHELAERLAQFLEIPPEERETFLRLARGLPPARPQASEPAGLSVPQPPLRTPPTNLVATLTPLIGREKDLERVGSLLRREEVRLATLCGPPGIGKTRLSLQAGRDALEEFADGVFFVALAPISDPELVPRTIAQALGIPETAGQSVKESLKISLRDRQMLLILDNFEQILEAAPLVAGLLAAAPRLKVLATSREALNLYGEVEYILEPLALPDPANTGDLEALVRVPSVRLFVERAQAVNVEFSLNSANAAAVAELCRRLDGLPLAIELAAARSNLFGPRALLKRLDHRLELLTGGARDLPPRQRTLRGAIEWSYSLLDESERALYRRLGVFAGSFDVEAAHAVAGMESDLPDAVLATLASLVAKSLVRRISPKAGSRVEPGEEDEPRFMMLETLREHAREQLVRSSEAEAILQRHACYYVGLAETAYPTQVGFIPQVRRWIERLELARPNSLAALDWLVSRGETELSLRLTGAMWPFWAIRGYLSEGRHALAAALELARAGDPGAGGAPEAVAPDSHYLALAYNGAGHLAFDQGDSTAARPLIEKSLEIWQKLGDTGRVAWALYGRALVQYNHAMGQLPVEGSLASRQALAESMAASQAAGDRWCYARALELLSTIHLNELDYDATQASLDECLAIFRDLGDSEGLALALHTQGKVAHYQGRYSEALAAYEECRTLLSDLDYRQQFAWVLNSLGWLTMDQGQYPLAASYFEQSRDVFREIGNEASMLWPQIMIGQVAMLMGDYEQAGAVLRYCLEHSQHSISASVQALYVLGLLALEQGQASLAVDHIAESLSRFLLRNNPGAVCESVEAVARAAMLAGLLEESARLYGAAETLRERIRTPLPPTEMDRYRSWVEALRAALGSQDFENHWATGRLLNMQAAVDLVMEVRDSLVVA